MTKLSSVNNCHNNLRGKEESEMFLDAKPVNPTIVGDTKTLNVTYIESAKQAYKKRKNHIYPLSAILLTLVIITWLTALTIVREYQLADLKREVKDLRASVEEIKQHYADDQLFDSLKEFEEEVKKSVDDGTDGTVIHKYDKADEDYYFDYADQDKAQPRHIDDDDDIDDVDFLGEVMEAKRPENIRLLTDDKDDLLTARNRRSSAYESSDEATTQNLARGVNRTNTDTRSSYQVVKPLSKVTARSADEDDDLNYRIPYNDRYRMPAVEKRPLYMNNAGNPRSNDDRRHYKKVEAIELYDEKDPPRSFYSQSPNLLVAHYHGDATNESKIVGYDSNGRVPHMHEEPFKAWSPAPWLSHNEMSTPFSMVDGALMIPERGIYFVYAQVYYHDTSAQNSYKVMRRNSINKKEVSILQCSVTSHPSVPVPPRVNPPKNANTCYTAGAYYLDAGDTLYIINVAGPRYNIMRHDKSFFGLFKLNDGPWE